MVLPLAGEEVLLAFGHIHLAVVVGVHQDNHHWEHLNILRTHLEKEGLRVFGHTHPVVVGVHRDTRHWEHLDTHLVVVGVRQDTRQWEELLDTRLVLEIPNEHFQVRFQVTTQHDLILLMHKKILTWISRHCSR